MPTKLLQVRTYHGDDDIKGIDRYVSEVRIEHDGIYIDGEIAYNGIIPLDDYGVDQVVILSA